MTETPLASTGHVRTDAIGALFSFQNPESESITGTDRWYDTTGEPEGILHYQYRVIEGGVAFTLHRPEAGHGFKVAQYVEGTADEYWVDTLDFRVTADSMKVRYEDPEGNWRVDPVREREQTGVVLFASEALTHGLDHA